MSLTRTAIVGDYLLSVFNGLNFCCSGSAFSGMNLMCTVTLAMFSPVCFSSLIAVECSGDSSLAVILQCPRYLVLNQVRSNKIKKLCALLFTRIYS